MTRLHQKNRVRLFATQRAYDMRSGIARWDLMSAFIGWDFQDVRDGKSGFDGPEKSASFGQS